METKKMVAVRKRNKLKHTKLNGQDLHTVVLHIDKKFDTQITILIVLVIHRVRT